MNTEEERRDHVRKVLEAMYFSQEDIDARIESGDFNDFISGKAALPTTAINKSNTQLEQQNQTHHVSRSQGRAGNVGWHL